MVGLPVFPTEFFADAIAVAGVDMAHLPAQYFAHVGNYRWFASVLLYFPWPGEATQIRCATRPGKESEILVSKSSLGQHLLVIGQRGDDLVSL